MMKDVMPSGLRRAIIGSACVHVAVAAIVLVVGGNSRRSAAKSERVLVTKLVRLGEPRPKDLLPRKVAPAAPPAKAVPSPAAVPSKSKPVPKQVKEAEAAQQSARERIDAMSRVRGALDRLKDAATPEGRPDGSANGVVSDLSRAIAGNKLATDVHRCLKANYAIEGVDPARVAGRSAKVWLRIAPNGEFIETKIEKGSGMPLFDRAVERAVTRCGSVSPPDPGIRDQARKDGVEVEFTP